jgi:DNA-binding transcriptional ArsR family regulator
MPSTDLLDRVDEMADFLAMLGNGKRLAIVVHLMDNELSVGTIAERVSLSQSALSQHLAKLRAMNLVDTRRDRQMIYYSCTTPRVRTLLQTLQGL